MGKIVHRICVPLCTSTVVRCMDYTIDNRIAEVHVRICHIELCTQHHATLDSLRCVHLVEQLKIFLYRTVAVR